MAQKHEEKKFRESVAKMTNEEIGVELKSLRDKLFTLRSQAVTEKVEDTSLFGITKRNIARLLTEQSARRIKDSGQARQPSEAGKKTAKAPKARASKPAKKTASTTTKKTAKKAKAS